MKKAFNKYMNSNKNRKKQKQKKQSVLQSLFYMRTNFELNKQVNTIEVVKCFKNADKLQVFMLDF